MISSNFLFLHVVHTKNLGIPLENNTCIWMQHVSLFYFRDMDLFLVLGKSFFNIDILKYTIKCMKSHVTFWVK